MKSAQGALYHVTTDMCTLNEMSTTGVTSQPIFTNEKRKPTISRTTTRAMECVISKAKIW